jgi:MFS family permease
LVALPWLILQLTASGTTLGGIMMVGAVPRAVLMLIGGVVTDRSSPRRILMATAAWRTLLVAAIAALIWLRLIGVWQLYMLSFCFGVADAFAAPAAQAFMPALVTSEQLPAANSVSQGTTRLAMLLAPGPVGMLVNAFGIAWAFFIDAVSFLFILGALWKLPDPPKTDTPVEPKKMAHAILEGLGYVKRDVPLRSLIMVAAALTFCTLGPNSVGIAILAKRHFGSATAFGLLMSSAAAGGLVGMLLAGTWKTRRRGLLLLGSSALIGSLIICIGLVKPFWALALLLFAMCSASGYMLVQLMAWFQQRVERAVLGRVMSVQMFAVVGLMPFSQAAAGIAVQWSLSGMFIGAGTLMILITAVAAMIPEVRAIE